MKLTDYDKQDIKKAVEIRFSECYGAMRITNIMAGRPNNTWDILHEHDAISIVEAAKRVGIDVENLDVAIPKGQKVKNSFGYLTLYPISSEEQYKKLKAIEEDMQQRIKGKVPEWETLYAQRPVVTRMLMDYEKREREDVAKAKLLYSSRPFVTKTWMAMNGFAMEFLNKNWESITS